MTSRQFKGRAIADDNGGRATNWTTAGATRPQTPMLRRRRLARIQRVAKYEAPANKLLQDKSSASFVEGEFWSALVLEGVKSDIRRRENTNLRKTRRSEARQSARLQSAE